MPPDNGPQENAICHDYLDAIEHLPEGATLRLGGISWDEYEA